MIKAEGAAWGQGFRYDGFGNLIEKYVTKGSAPALSVLVDRTTNRVAAYSYDANGNQTSTNNQWLGYDNENRLGWLDNRNNTGEMYGYDPGNLRVYRAEWSYQTGTGVYQYANETVSFYSPGGQPMGAYRLTASPGQPPYYGPSVSFVFQADRVYFGRKVLWEAGQWVSENRLGSVGSFYPYGETRGAGGSSFATYSRDGSGLDYAVNRYYWSSLGRFMSADPWWGSVVAGDPRTWNRLAYVNGDPVNANDPDGLGPIVAPGCNQAKQMAGSVGGTTAGIVCPSTMPEPTPAPSIADLYNSSGLAVGMPSPGGSSVGAGSSTMAAAQALYIGQTVIPGFLGLLTPPQLQSFDWIAGTQATSINITYNPMPGAIQAISALMAAGGSVVPLGESAQTVFALVNAANPQGMINAFMVGSVAVGTRGGLAASALSGGLAGVPLAIGPTPVLGGIAYTSQFLGNSNFTSLWTMGTYTWNGVNVPWLNTMMATGQSFLVGPDGPNTAQEIDYILLRGYVRIGTFLVP